MSPRQTYAPLRWKALARRKSFCSILSVCCALSASPLKAGVGDPQVATDHLWYPGELDCSTFERLFASQARLYKHVTGSEPQTEEQKALASWLWRNTHYFHGEEGAEDLWGKGFRQGGDLRTREYWTGLFAHGFGLCGTTHSQWTAEMQRLLGHNRGRDVGVAGHNSFEVFLTGNAYGAGKWVLLDHDVSTVAFDEQTGALLSIAEIQKDWKRLLNRTYKPERQHGWPVCGLHPGDASAFQEYNDAEYLAGYEGVPPVVNLRRGETLRRYSLPDWRMGIRSYSGDATITRGGFPVPNVRSHGSISRRSYSARAMVFLSNPGRHDSAMQCSRTGRTLRMATTARALSRRMGNSLRSSFTRPTSLLRRLPQPSLGAFMNPDAGMD